MEHFSKNGNKTRETNPGTIIRKKNQTPET